MVTSIDALADAVVAHLDTRPTPPEVIALGEPTHGEPAFLRLWTRALDRLIDRGVRSVALETDAVRALTLDAWVRGGDSGADGRTVPLDEVLATGFSHGFGERPGMRGLVALLRVRNDELPPEDRVAVHGIDLPTEVSGAPSPRPSLEFLRTYLVDALGPAAIPVDGDELDALLGPDEPWGTWEAQLDAAASVGASPGAVALRAVVDDLLALRDSAAPRLIEATSRAAWEVAGVHGRSARGLLRYHAVAGRSGEDRLGRLLAIRDVGIAGHVRAVRTRERHRGPTVVLAHDGHLQRGRTSWSPGWPDAAQLSWSSAGSLVALELGEDYVHVAGALGASAATGLGPPPPGSVEAGLLAAAGGTGLVVGRVLDDAVAGLGTRDDLPAAHGYVAPSAASLTGADAVVVLDHPEELPGPERDPSVVDLAARLLALPGVTHLRADAASGAPAAAHGDWFFYARAGDRMPFATIVVSDYPGHDEASRLGRAGVFRLNLGVGREAGAAVVGGPLDAGYDHDEPDRFAPHPLYAAQGWIAVLNPAAGRLAEIDRLAEVALARARRAER